MHMIDSMFRFFYRSEAGVPIQINHFHRESDFEVTEDVTSGKQAVPLQSKFEWRWKSLHNVTLNASSQLKTFNSSITGSVTGPAPEWPVLVTPDKI